MIVQRGMQETGIRGVEESSSGTGLNPDSAFDISWEGVAVRAGRTAERKVTESRTQSIHHATWHRRERVIRRGELSVIVPLGTLLLVFRIVDGCRPTVLIIRNVLCRRRRGDAQEGRISCEYSN